ncbi:NTP transferase domain-containing protein [Methanomicrobium antiquum]|uniref:NTP transferase domain-containing protein n=1 Tax=Methanomicrobium antiquum TaxID=487686 RepID=A0AAF0JMU6_9EURY|nr:sugar phosphate nucleotidyltransferase [Methanomicrobium antiquum]WFN36791.1 NTP transferase domain-containing protein [Methanomicrobium antiquum]
MLPVVILAGGLATRLYPITKTIPKSMIEIAGRPFIDHQLELLKEKGVEEVILCLGNLGESVEAHVGDGSQFGINVRYSYDGEKLLGTGGALKKAGKLLPDDFVILYGDSYLDIDIEQIIQHYYEEELPVLMTVYKNNDAFDKSNIVLKDSRVVRYEKNVSDPEMIYIDYGLIVIRKEIFSGYPADEPFDLSLVISDSVNLGIVSAFVVENRFYETGSVQGIKETEDYIINRKPRF